jgi:aspartate/methionine/tyrosine aminotransferase
MYPSSTAQCLAIAVLRQDYVPYLDGVRTQYEEKARRLHKRICEIPGVDVDVPHGGVYLFPRLPRIAGQNAARAIIRDTHLLCVPGDVAGPSCTDRVRLFIGVPDTTLDDAADRVRRRLDELSRK